jgi:hypothetical protein
VSTETSRKILEVIDNIIASLGHKDFEQFRTTMATAAILLANLANYSERVSSWNREDVTAFIDGIPEADQEKMLRLMSGLEDYLPTLGQVLINVAQILPQSKGGHPASFKDRDSERKACDLVLYFIGKGYGEPEAKKLAAKRLGVNPRTMHRIWKRSVELKEELSFEEFFQQFLSGLATQQPSQSLGSLTEGKADNVKPESTF